MSDICLSVGQRVRTLREGQDIAQDTLASTAGLSPSYLSAMEAGRKNVGLVNLERLASALGTPLATFFSTPEFCEVDPASRNVRYVDPVTHELVGAYERQTLPSLEHMVVEAMRKNAHVTIVQLTKLTGASHTSIETTQRQLKKLHAIERVGSRRGGSWVVLPAADEVLGPSGGWAGRPRIRQDDLRLDADVRQRFGARLRYLRQARRLPQDEFAGAVGTDRTQLVRIEGGQLDVPVRHALKLAGGLGLTLAGFFDCDGFRSLPAPITPLAHDPSTRANALEERVLAHLAKHPQATLLATASTLGVTQGRVSKAVAALKADGRLLREGSRRSGRWLVVGQLATVA